MISVLGIPYDNNSSYLKGPALAPDKIREAFHSDSSNYFTESGLDLKNNTHWEDVGNVVFTEDAFVPTIESRISQLIASGNKIFTLGGDHSLTYPVVRAVGTQHKNLTILHLDAHPDLYHDFEGNPHSHASPFARIMEQNLCLRLIQVGIRTMNQHQREQARRFGVEVIEMKNWVDVQQIKIDGPAYLSLDMDVVDPAFAPGVSHHEPGGFTTRQLLTILQSLHVNFVGADLVEFNPTRDPSDITAMLAAKLFKEILDMLLRR